VTHSFEPLETAKILVASDVPSDAQMVCEMLGAAFKNTAVSTDPQTAISDFEQCQPVVLILAFNTLEKAKHYDLELYRLSHLVQDLPHRTVVLCSSESLHGAYDLCRTGHFDDYVLFWPLVHDALRLPMAVLHALHDVQSAKNAVPATELARMTHRIAQLEGLLAAQLDEGRQRAEKVKHSATCAVAEVNQAIDQFTGKILKGDLKDTIQIINPDRFQLEIEQLKAIGLQTSLRAVSNEVQSLTLWVQKMQNQRATNLASAQALSEQAGRLQPLVLIVDDNEFERKLIGKILDETTFELIFAASGVEALGILRKRRPDLILMDLDMPDINGLETTRRLKACAGLASIPVMMVTGKSGKGVVVDCLQAGAADFAVKPLDRDAFLKKMDKLLAG